jgi:ADP-heptose:LPS heptosyltransferase
MDRIVVFRPGALGDTLLTFPALAALRRAFPGARLAVIGNAPPLALARDAGLADAIFEYDLPWWAELFSEDGIRSPQAREVLADARLVVLWIGRDVEQVTRNLRAVGAQQIISAPGRPPADRQTHAADYLLETLLPVIGEPSLRQPGMMPLPIAPEAERWAAEEWALRGLMGKRVLALHPGSGGRSKCWPPERFAALAGRFLADGWHILVIEGPADGPAATQVMQTLAPERVQRLSGLSLPQLAALLARVALYVGNDSGVTHLAALVGAPTLALFGPTNPAIWSPRGPRVQVVWHGAGARGEAESAATVVPASQFPQAPAAEGAAHPGAAGHPMTDLSVDEMFAAARALLTHQDQSTDLRGEIC